MNKCFLVGNLTKDPEVASTNNGIAVTKFTIACNRQYTNADGEREADFLNIVTWRGLAENCAKYLSKGNKVAITGSIQTRSYEDKDGNKRYVTEIIADEVEFIKTNTMDEGKANNVAKRNAGKKTLEQISFGGPVSGDDFPF
jgi:single-strand DNA-binding protein